MKRIAFHFFLISCISISGLNVAFATGVNYPETGIKEEDSTSFEWGPSLLLLRMNHYRGSDQYMNKVIPFPYFCYESKHVEAEPSYVRGTIFENNYFSLKISVMAGLSVDSTENAARKDMPDLDYLFEIGPMLILKLWKSDNNIHQLTIESPLRRVFSTNFTSVDQVGWWSVPYINYRINPNKYTLGFAADLSTAVMFADNGYHDYFYSVNKEYVTNERAEYDAVGGYSGFQLCMVLEKRIGNFIFIPVVRYDYLKRTVFEDSPLVKTKNYFAFLLAGIYLVK